MKQRLWGQSTNDPKSQEAPPSSIAAEQHMHGVLGEQLALEGQLEIDDQGDREEGEALAPDRTQWAAQNHLGAYLFRHDCVQEGAAMEGEAVLAEPPQATGLDDEKVAAGLDDEKVAAGLDDEKVATGLDDEKVATGLDDEKVAAGLDDEKVAAEVERGSEQEGAAMEGEAVVAAEKIPTPWLEPFLAMMVCENGAAKNTQQAYTTDMMRWFRFAHTSHIQTIGPEHHPMFVVFLKSIPLADRSISRNLSAVRHYFYFLSTEGIIPHDPWQGLRNPQYRAQLPQPLSVESVAVLLRQAHQDDSVEGIRLSAVLEILYATGMRISELIALPTFQLDDDSTPSLRITGKGGHERFVFFTPQAKAALDRYTVIRFSFLPSPESISPHLFPSRGKSGHLTRQRVGQLLKELAFRAGICPESVNPHGLRHAFATHLLQRGVDLVTLKHLLGHQDISTTQIYTHVQTERWTDLLTRHHPLGRRIFPGILD